MFHIRFYGAVKEPHKAEVTMTDMDKVIDEARAEQMPYESWEKLPGETALAFSAFCAFRDLGAERNIRKAVETSFAGKEHDTGAVTKKYHSWRNLSTQFKWRERAAEYDRYTEKLKQAEFRKTIEAQGEKHREVTGKMLDMVSRKLDTMNPAELAQGNVTEWVQTAVKVDREAAGLVAGNDKPEAKQGEFNFTPDFQGL